MNLRQTSRNYHVHMFYFMLIMPDTVFYKSLLIFYCGCTLIMSIESCMTKMTLNGHTKRLKNYMPFYKNVGAVTFFLQVLHLIVSDTPTYNNTERVWLCAPLIIERYKIYIFAMLLCLNHCPSKLKYSSAYILCLASE